MWKMISLEQNFEEAVRKSGFNIIAGIDEAGRGAWAGPIVAAGVIFAPNVKIFGVNDSKKLTQKQREELFTEIQEKALLHTIVEISSVEIDKYGVGWANAEVIRRVIQILNPEYALIDKAWVSGIEIPHELIIKGDSKVFSIAAASILAKVYRDKRMRELAIDHPEYGLEVHKGYGTAKHDQALKKHGPCLCHRKSYKPISQLTIAI